MRNILFAVLDRRCSLDEFPVGILLAVMVQDPSRVRWLHHRRVRSQSFEIDMVHHKLQNRQATLLHNLGALIPNSILSEDPILANKYGEK